jgi:hypothetical protein
MALRCRFLSVDGSTWPLLVGLGQIQPSSGFPPSFHRCSRIARTRGVIGRGRRAAFVLPCVTSIVPNWNSRSYPVFGSPLADDNAPSQKSRNTWLSRVMRQTPAHSTIDPLAGITLCILTFLPPPTYLGDSPVEVTHSSPVRIRVGFFAISCPCSTSRRTGPPATRDGSAVPFRQSVRSSLRHAASVDGL